jgi:tRNA-specific 2-thiouridylase
LYEKLFVIRLEAESKTVWVGDEQHLYHSHAVAENPHLIDDLSEGEELTVKVRYSHKGSLAKVFNKDGKLHFEFSEPQRAITPGQAAVLYRGKQLVGGAWIQ